MDTIESLITEFAGRIKTVAEQSCVQRMLEQLGAKSITFTGATKKNGRRRGPIQLCPVPGCSWRAAPVYGMLCKVHKDTPKKLVAKYREARRKKAKKS